MMGDTVVHTHPIYMSSKLWRVYRMSNNGAPWPFYHIQYVVRSPYHTVEAFFLDEHQAIKFADAQ